MISTRENILRIVSSYSKSAHTLDQNSEATNEIEISDLQIDSLSKLELIMRIEEEYGCEFSEQELAACQKIGDLLALCERHVKS